MLLFGERAQFGDSVGGKVSLGSQFRQAKIKNLCMSTLRYKDVGWLDVTMNDSFCMRGVQRLGNLNSQLQDLLDHQRLPGNTVFESLALQQLHRDERSSIGLVNFVDRANVRV